MATVKRKYGWWHVEFGGSIHVFKDFGEAIFWLGREKRFGKENTK